ncbi:MAG: NeuD/PglB/VioB family sugar acetyltransferase [Desertimonas sp.]
MVNEAPWLDRPVVVMGAGGHALVVTETLRAAGRRVIGWVSDDDHPDALVERIALTRAGTVADLDRMIAAGTHDVFVAIGDNRRRAEITERLRAAGAVLATAVSPAAVVSPSARLGTGVLIMPGAVVNALTEIGDGVIVNTAASVDHECVVGEFAHLAPHGALAGNVRVGPGAFIGIGAAVIPGRTLGAWCVVGAGAAVVDDVAEAATVGGVPARPLGTNVTPAATTTTTTSTDRRGPAGNRPPPAALAPPGPEILVVCTGNLCRSPLVAGLLADQLERAGVPAVVRSAGTFAPREATPDRRMRRAAHEVGIDLDRHRSTPLDAAMAERADLIITMTAEHDAQVAALAPSVSGRIVRLRRAAWRSQVVREPELGFEEWVKRLSHSGPTAEQPRTDRGDDIADPVGGPMRAYRAMAEEVTDLVAVLVQRWRGR